MEKNGSLQTTRMLAGVNTDPQPSPLAVLELTPDIFVPFLKFCQPGPPRSFKIIKNALPADAQLHKVFYDQNRYPPVISLVVESNEFPLLKPGATYPIIDPVVVETIIESRLEEIQGCDKCELCDEHGDLVEINAGKHQAVSQYNPICKFCGLADIAGDWDLYPCNDEWRKVIATQP